MIKQLKLTKYMAHIYIFYNNFKYAYHSKNRLLCIHSNLGNRNGAFDTEEFWTKI